MTKNVALIIAGIAIVVAAYTTYELLTLKKALKDAGIPIPAKK